MDDKGRLKIPADFKRYLEETYKSADFYVTSLTGEDVWIYPLKEWEEKEKRLALVPSTAPALQRYMDRVSYFGQMQQMDSQGRLLIHPLLRGAAELMGEVMVMGKVDYLDVWEAEKFRTSRLLAQPFTELDFEALSNYGI
jgi:MraZ protein